MRVVFYATRFEGKVDGEHCVARGESDSSPAGSCVSKRPDGRSGMMETKVLVLAQSDCHPLFELKAHCLCSRVKLIVSVHRLQLS